MNERIFFEQLLSISDLKVDRISHEARQIVLHCHSEQQGQACPRCGSIREKPVRRYEERQVRDLDMSGKAVWLYLKVRQFHCECGHYFQEPFKWVAPGKSYTLRQAKFIFEMCARQPFSEVGAIVKMNAKSVERLYYAQAQPVINLPQRYAELTALGIDEVSLHKGQGDYCCVLTDLPTGTQLDILPNRKKETLVAHFQELGSGFCQHISHVSCDMWGPYTQVAKQCFAQAKITIDRFHVVKALNDVLDGMRKTLGREQPQEEDFKKLKWVLFKPGAHLTDEQHQALGQAFRKAPKLQKAYQLRNSFHHIFDYAQDKKQASQWLERWIKEVQGSKTRLGISFSEQ